LFRIDMTQDPSLGSLLTTRSLDQSLNQAIWHNPLTNEIAWSQLSGSTIVATKALPTTSADWQLTATGDVNRDGELDVLWRNRQTGNTLWWLLRDGSVSDGQFIVGVPADPSFQIVGTGDVNLDGNLDLIWQHPTYGAVVWDMPALMGRDQPIAPIRGRTIAAPGFSPNWQLVTTGDVNQDGGLDALWVNRLTGSSQWWQMQQGSGVGSSRLNSPIGPNQRITASADLNGDGALDLVVRDVTLGTSDLWVMSKPDINGTISTISRSVVTGRERLGTIDGWQIAGVAKMDAGNTLGNATLELDGRFSRSQTIGGLNDRSDVYKFGLGTAGVFSASLSGLSADADVRVIQDSDNNGQIGPGEVLAWNWERRNKAETLEVFLNAGIYYFLEVRSYDDQLTNYQLTTSFSPTATAPSKLDIQLTYDVTSAGLSQTTRNALEEAAKFWEAALSGGGTLVPGGVLPIRIVTEDLNLKSGGPDNVTLAYSGPTATTNGQTLLISGASATINRRRINTIGFDDQKSLFIHEFTHALGFGTLWEPLQFRNADGSISAIGGLAADGNRLINRNNNRYHAESYAGWAYTDLLRDARRPTTIAPTAVPIEAGIFAHWDESVFVAESLTPVANSGYQPISHLTLAAMRDLGWKVNYGKAMAYDLPTTASAAPVIDFADLNRPTVAAGNVMANDMPDNIAVEWSVG
jgi:FG-GAP-like repeat